MALKKIVALKKGTFTSKNGKTVVIDDKKLDDIVAATHNLEEEDFAITIGHPTGSAPAWGWINKKNVKREGDTLVLFAEEERLDKRFLKWLKEKLYKKVSLAFREDNSIHHLAFLGAMPPAVKGMPVTEFSGMEDITEIELSEADIELAEFELSKWWIKILQSAIRNIKNFVIEQKNAEEANKIIPEHVIEELGNSPYIRRVNNDKSETTFSGSNNNLNIEEEHMEKTNEDLQKEIEQLTAKNSTLQNDLNSANTQLSEKDLSMKRDAYVSFCESDNAKNKIKPADQEGIIQLMGAAENTGIIEFSEGEGENKVEHNINLLDVVKNLIKNQPDVVSLSEEAIKGVGKTAINDEVTEGQEMADLVNK